MSYILEALRRSEETRRRREGRDLTMFAEPDAPVRAPSARALPWLAAGLALNAIVLGAWLLRAPAPHGDFPVPAPSTGVAAATNRPVSPEIEVSPAEPGPAMQPSGAAADRGPPRSIGSLPRSMRDRLPILNLSTHIYADDPTYREVGINGHTYREGDMVDGLELLQITESGIHLGFEDRVIRVELRDQWGL